MSLAGLCEKELAVRLTAAVLGEWQRIGVDIQVRFWDALLERYIGTAKRSMKVEDVEREWAQGRNMTFDEAITLAGPTDRVSTCLIATRSS